MFEVFNAEGEFLLKFGCSGEGNGQFNAPTGVAVDLNGNIIVADWGNSRIQVTHVAQCSLIMSTRKVTNPVTIKPSLAV